MRYARNETVLLEPDHEEVVIDDKTVDLAVEPVRVKLVERIHSDQNPFVTYWEVEYLVMTPNHSVGQTRVMTENMISNYEVPEVTEEQEKKATVSDISEPNESEPESANTENFNSED